MDDIVQELRAARAALERHSATLQDSETSLYLRAANEIERLRKIVWEQVYQVHLTDRPDFYPCLLCGYNGPGFWQPDKHPCAAMERATDREIQCHE